MGFIGAAKKIDVTNIITKKSSSSGDTGLQLNDLLL